MIDRLLRVAVALSVLLLSVDALAGNTPPRKDIVEMATVTAGLHYKAVCGKTYYLRLNTGGTTILDLPTTSPGCTVRVANIMGGGASYLLKVTPADAASRIVTLTAVDGHSITSQAVGATVTLFAYSTTQWLVLGSKGSWSDVP